MPAVSWSGLSPGRRERLAARLLEGPPCISTSTRADQVRESGSRPAALARSCISRRPMLYSSGETPEGCQPSPTVAARFNAPGLEPPIHSGMWGFWSGLGENFRPEKFQRRVWELGVGVGPKSLIKGVASFVKNAPLPIGGP